MSEQPASTRKRTGLWIGVAIAAVAIIGAAIAIPVAISNAEASQQQAEQAARDAELEADQARLNTFYDALKACNIERGDYVKVLDLGESIDFRYVGYPAADVSLDDMSCFLGELDAPSSLESKMGATRALDGVQTEQWDGFKITWRYHPKDGATVTVDQT